VNRIANTSVIVTPSNVALRLPSIRAWCAYVTVAPDDRSRIVLSNGIANGLRASIPLGGQCEPNSTVGASEEWKSVYYLSLWDQ
jgi:hypothetical protein